MTVDQLSIAANQAGNLESELADGRAHSINGVVVLARVPGILTEPFDGPDFDPLGDWG